MRGVRLLLTAVGALLCGPALTAAAQSATRLQSTQLAADCVAQPTPKCLLADAQAAAMSMTENRTALADLAFIGWAQALSGDRDAALDTLRVSELRAIGAGPDLLANYSASMAGVWAVLKDEAKTKAAIAAALRHLGDVEADGRAIALSDAAYADALLGDRAAAAASVQQAIGEAHKAGGDPFLLVYIGWNQALVGDRGAGLSMIREALDALDAPPEKDQGLVVWTVAYAAIGQAVANDASAAATRDRLQQTLTDSPTADGNIEAWMMLAWSYGQSGGRERAESIVREHLPDAYRATDYNTKAIALTCAAFALAPPIHVNP